jgi:hypothetical protein
MTNLTDIARRADAVRRRIKRLDAASAAAYAELNALNGAALAESSRMRGACFEMRAHDTLPDGVAAYRLDAATAYQAARRPSKSQEPVS